MTFHDKNLLTVSCWNINGLEGKVHGSKTNKLEDIEVVNFLSKSDIFGIVETHTDQTNDIYFNDYFVFRKDRPKHKKAWRSSGGIAVFVRKSIKQSCKFDPMSDSDIIWVRILKDFTNLGYDLFLAFVYIPPSNSSYGKINTREIIEKVEKQVEYFSCKGKVIICGDFNARVGDKTDYLANEDEKYFSMPDDAFEHVLPRFSCDSKSVNQSGKWLTDLCMDHQLYILNGRTLGDFTGQFTCHTPRGSSIVDYFICSRSLSNYIFSMCVSDITVLSDHCAITMKLQIKGNFLLQDNVQSCDINTDFLDIRVPDKFIWSDEVKSRYQNAFNSEDVINELKLLDDSLNLNNENGQTYINKLTNVLTMAGNRSLKRISFKSRKPIKRTHKKWFDKDCRVVLKEVNKAKNAFGRNVFNIELRQKYYSKLKEYKKLVKYKKKKFKDNLTNTLCTAMENDPQKAWKIINALKNESAPPDKAEKINSSEWYAHFQSLLQGNTTDIDRKRQEAVKQELNQFENSDISGHLDYIITEKEILDACKKLKNNKASAYDMVKNEMIRSAIPFIKQIVLKIFNGLLISGQFPIAWTEGIIVPLHKQGSYTDPNNYRGITLSSCLGKLFCHVLNARISKYLENNNLLAREQAGFRNASRTADNIFVIKTIVDKYVRTEGKGKKLFACFIDLKKAFDTVWHEGLLLKLQKVGINGQLYKIIKSMYQNTFSRVKCKHNMTGPIRITQGVHQGNVLSPVLFNLFINDIGNNFNIDDSPLLDGLPVSHLLYADDLVLLSTSDMGLQNNIDMVDRFCKDWGLAVNKEKSKIIAFSKSGRSTKNQFRFTIGTDELEYVNQYKYLGVIFSSSGKFSVAEKTLAFKARRALFSIKQSMSDQNMKPSVLLQIFDALVKPVALYSSEVWTAYKPCYQGKGLDDLFDMSLKSNNEFDKVHIKYCKYVLGVHSKACNLAVYSELGRVPLLMSAIINSINFWLHMIQSKRDSLINKAYSEQLHASNTKGTWVRFIENLLTDLGFSHVWHNQFTFNKTSLLTAIKQKLREKFIIFWQKRMAVNEGQNKLRTYKCIKEKFGLEPYLEHIKDKSLRAGLSSLRISAHKLRIETGRYKGEDVNDRKCDTCMVLEDEVHFLCQCSKYNAHKLILYGNLKEFNFLVDNNPTKTFINLMTCTDMRIIKAICIYIKACHIT